MSGPERAVAAARDPDEYFARVRAESEAAAAADVREREQRRALETRVKLLRLIGLRGLAERLAGRA
ncbi:hypothetical protein [Kribbella yunnanensis]